MAIREDYVDGVDCLLRFEETNHQPGTAYSWEAVDQVKILMFNNSDTSAQFDLAFHVNINVRCILALNATKNT